MKYSQIIIFQYEINFLDPGQKGKKNRAGDLVPPGFRIKDEWFRGKSILEPVTVCLL
jgi:hypothetical protein